MPPIKKQREDICPPPPPPPLPHHPPWKLLQSDILNPFFLFRSCSITIVNYWKDCWYWCHLWYCAKWVSATIHYHSFNGKEPYNLCICLFAKQGSVYVWRDIHVMNMIWRQGDRHLSMHWRLDVLSFGVLSWIPFIHWLVVGVGNGRCWDGQMPMVCNFIGGRSPTSFLFSVSMT